MMRTRAGRRRHALVVLALLAAACQHTGTAETVPATDATPGLAGPGRDQARPSATAMARADQPTLIDYGNKLLAAQEPDLALKAFTRSISTEGVSAEALMGAGIAAAQQGMIGSARQYLEDARDLDPHSVTVNNNLGVVLFQLKEYDLARDAFRTAYAVSSGTSEFAEHNLNRAEAMLAAIAEAGGQDPAVTYRVERQGTSHFRLVEIDAAGGGAEAEEEEPEH